MELKVQGRTTRRGVRGIARIFHRKISKHTDRAHISQGFYPGKPDEEIRWKNQENEHQESFDG